MNFTLKENFITKFPTKDPIRYLSEYKETFLASFVMLTAFVRPGKTVVELSGVGKTALTQSEIFDTTSLNRKSVDNR